MTALGDALGAASPWPAALAASLLASALAWRLGALSGDGAVAAVAVGTVVAGAGGWRWAALLLGFVTAASAASALPPRPQAPRRNARQVLANGLVAAVAAGLHGLGVAPAGAVFAAALSAGWADTWATEFGVRYGGRPRRLWGREPLEPGVSGGITTAGTAAGVLAAVCCGGLAGALAIAPTGWTAGAGLVGMLVDSAVGGAVQGHYRCSTCGREGESVRCPCGGRTQRVRGLWWVDNDATNLLATAAAGALGLWGSLPGGLP